MFNERGVKEAFDKVKQDIFNLGREISSMKTEFLDIKDELKLLKASVDSLKLSILTPSDSQTDRQIIPTHSGSPTDNPTVPCEIGGLKYPNLDISMRNRGVPTDRQTDQQTDNSAHSASVYLPPAIQESHSPSLSDSFLKATEILDSLDNLKKEIRLKFKTITQQEMLVFSSIYQLQERQPEGVEYRHIASRLGLSESSIRDYVQKIISKGIPVDKTKLNNKKILLKISPELKKVATLDTLIKLREL